MIDNCTLQFLPVYIKFCRSNDEADKYAKKTGHHLDHTKAISTTFDLGRTAACGYLNLIILLRDLSGHTLNEKMSIIAHEATHCMQYAMEAIGEEKPSVECQAYMVQYIFYCAANFFFQSKQKAHR